MNNYLIDTNIIIDYLRSKEKAVIFLNSLDTHIISAITVAEIYQGVRDKHELKLSKELLNVMRIIPIDESISTMALDLVEKHTLSSGLLILDSLIAATALQHNLTLFTSNVKHFKMIKGLKIEKW